jgi:hypothetical protein
VVAVEHNQSSGIEKFLDHQKNIRVREPDVFKVGVFPELIPVAGFHVHITVVVVILQGVQKDILVSGEFVGSAVVSPVGITEKDIPGTIVEIFKFGFFVCSQEPFVGEHTYHSNTIRIWTTPKRIRQKVM